MNTEIINASLTMSSLEIADLTGKRHDNVIRDIEKMLAELEIALLTFEGSYTGKDNSKRTCYNLPKRECLILVSGYSVVLRAKIIDRWMKLEAKEQSKYLAWDKARQEGKIARREETDTIKKFVEYATEQGSKNANMYYVNITKGVYGALFMLEKGTEWKMLRDRLNVVQLQHLATSEFVAQKYLEEGMKMNMHYKDIYKYAIAKVEEMVGILGKGQVTSTAKLGVIK